jgi:hypothetical protein
MASGLGCHRGKALAESTHRHADHSSSRGQINRSVLCYYIADGRRNTFSYNSGSDGVLIVRKAKVEAGMPLERCRCLPSSFPGHQQHPPPPITAPCRPGHHWRNRKYPNRRVPRQLSRLSCNIKDLCATCRNDEQTRPRQHCCLAKIGASLVQRDMCRECFRVCRNVVMSCAQINLSYGTAAGMTGMGKFSAAVPRLRRRRSGAMNI